MGKGFTHLHLHSEYSLLDGAIGFGRLFEKCGRMGMGAVEFYTKAQAESETGECDGETA